MKITTQVNYTGLPRKHGVFDAFLIRSLSQPWGFHRFLAQVNASSALKLKQHSCRGANCNHCSKGFPGSPGISWWLVRMLSGEAHMKKIGTCQHFFRAKSTLTGEFHLEIRQKQGPGSLQSLSSTAVSVFLPFNLKLSCPSRLRGPLPDRGPIMAIIELNSSLEWTTAVSPS